MPGQKVGLTSKLPKTRASCWLGYQTGGNCIVRQANPELTWRCTNLLSKQKLAVGCSAP